MIHCHQWKTTIPNFLDKIAESKDLSPVLHNIYGRINLHKEYINWTKWVSEFIEKDLKIVGVVPKDRKHKTSEEIMDSGYWKEGGNWKEEVNFTITTKMWCVSGNFLKIWLFGLKDNNNSIFTIYLKYIIANIYIDENYILTSILICC